MAASLYMKKLTSQDGGWSSSRRQQQPPLSKRAPKLHRAVPVPGVTELVPISIAKDTFFSDLAAPAKARAARLEDFFHTSAPQARSSGSASPKSPSNLAFASLLPSSPLPPLTPNPSHRPLTAYEKWRSEMSVAAASPLKSVGRSSSKSALHTTTSPRLSRSQSGSIHRHPRQGGRWVSLTTRTPPPTHAYLNSISSASPSSEQQVKKQRRAWPISSATLTTAAWIGSHVSTAPEEEDEHAARGGASSSQPEDDVDTPHSAVPPPAAAVSGGRFSRLSSLMEMVRSGDVLLLRGRWVLERAGYVEEEVRNHIRTKRH